jgi:hypothetical protein
MRRDFSFHRRRASQRHRRALLSSVLLIQDERLLALLTHSLRLSLS